MAEHLDLPGKDAKIGGHSIWLWGGILGGAVVLYMWYSGRQANATPATVTVADPNSLAGDALPASVSGASGSGGSLAGSDSGALVTDPNGTDPSGTDPSGTDPSGTDGTDAAYVDNQTWEQTAVAYLTAHGVSGINAQQTLEKYLGGETLTYQQAGWLNQAIASNGIAPEGVAAIPSYLAKPKPHVTPPHKAPVVHKSAPTHKAPVKHAAPAHKTASHPTASHAPVKHPAPAHKTASKPKPKPKAKVTIKKKGK